MDKVTIKSELVDPLSWSEGQISEVSKKEENLEESLEDHQNDVDGMTSTRKIRDLHDVKENSSFEFIHVKEEPSFDAAGEEKIDTTEGYDDNGTLLNHKSLAMPNKRKVRNYTEQQIVNALADIHSGMSLRKASVLHSVPISTLFDKKHGKHATDKPGPATYLTPEQEVQLSSWIKNMAAIGYSKTKQDIPKIVKEIIDKMGLEDEKFKDNLPSRSWVYSFLNRHDDISARIPEHLGTGRARVNVSKEIIENWFSVLDSFLMDEFQINAKTFFVEANGQRIFNLDESGFPLGGAMGPKVKVLAQRGDKSVLKVGPETNEQITVLANISAAGVYLKPLIIYPGIRFNVNFGSVNPDLIYVGKSKSGWMNSEVFFGYISNCFYPYLIENKVQFPVIVFLDGHSSNINLALSEFCRSKNIILYCLPPHASHVIQPLDVCFFGPLKANWNKQVAVYAVNNPLTCMTKSSFLSVFIKAWNASTNSKNAKAGFRKCGLVPYDSNSIDYTKLVSSRTAEIKKSNNIDSTQNRLLSAKVAFQQSLNMLESEWPANEIAIYRRRIAEQLDVPDIESTHNWNIYKGIHEMMTNCGTSNLLHVETPINEQTSDVDDQEFSDIEVMTSTSYVTPSIEVNINETSDDDDHHTPARKKLNLKNYQT